MGQTRSRQRSSMRRPLAPDWTVVGLVMRQALRGLLLGGAVYGTLSIGLVVLLLVVRNTLGTIRVSYLSVIADPYLTPVLAVSLLGSLLMASTAALSVAGVPTERFTFLGFLPRRDSARRDLLSSLTTSPLALVTYEAPHRLLKTLTDLHELYGERPMAAAAN